MCGGQAKKAREVSAVAGKGTEIVGTSSMGKAVAEQSGSEGNDGWEGKSSSLHDLEYFLVGEEELEYKKSLLYLNGGGHVIACLWTKSAHIPDTQTRTAYNPGGGMERGTGIQVWVGEATGTIEKGPRHNTGGMVERGRKGHGAGRDFEWDHMLHGS